MPALQVSRGQSVLAEVVFVQWGRGRRPWPKTKTIEGQRYQFQREETSQAGWVRGVYARRVYYTAQRCRCGHHEDEHSAATSVCSVCACPRFIQEKKKR